MVGVEKKTSSEDDEPGGRDKIVLGVSEEIIVGGEKVVARVDTGAEKSSICRSLVDRLRLGPVVGTTEIKSANGVEERDLIEVPIIVSGIELKSKFTVTDRSHMRYSVLLGINVLSEGFLVDVTK